METSTILIICVVIFFLLIIMSSGRKKTNDNIQKIDPLVKRKLDKEKSIEFAKGVINNKEKYVILDTETTGLGENDVIVQIGIIDIRW